jgi:hypothetical protein
MRCWITLRSVMSREFQTMPLMCGCRGNWCRATRSAPAAVAVAQAELHGLGEVARLHHAAEGRAHVLRIVAVHELVTLLPTVSAGS